MSMNILNSESISVNKILVAEFMAESFTEPKCVGKNVGIVKAAT